MIHRQCQSELDSRNFCATCGKFVNSSEISEQPEAQEAEVMLPAHIVLSIINETEEEQQ
jgi:hypothetical protein